jgi:hypothetical protein
LIVRHIRNVQENCIILGEKLIDKGEFDMGRRLIENGFRHDSSKFSGIEWEYMDHYQGGKDTTKLKLAVEQHGKTNPHHPEYWSSIHAMPDLYLAELACDWKARSQEFGTSLTDWINDTALDRFKFKKDDEVYKKIMEYVEMLCEKPFVQQTEDMKQ